MDMTLSKALKGLFVLFAGAVVFVFANDILFAWRVLQ